METQIANVLMWGWNMLFCVIELLFNIFQWNWTSKDEETKSFTFSDLEEAVKESEIAAFPEITPSLQESEKLQISENQKSSNEDIQNAKSHCESIEEMEELAKEVPTIPTPISKPNAQNLEAKKENKKKRIRKTKKEGYHYEPKLEISEKKQKILPPNRTQTEHFKENKFRTKKIGSEQLNRETVMPSSTAALPVPVPAPVPVDSLAKKRYEHSVLKHEVQESTVLTAPVVRPIRQPVSPDGSTGFSDSYRRSRTVHLAVSV